MNSSSSDAHEQFAGTRRLRAERGCLLYEEFIKNMHFVNRHHLFKQSSLNSLKQLVSSNYSAQEHRTKGDAGQASGTTGHVADWAPTGTACGRFTRLR